MNERIKELLIQSEVFNKDGTILKDVCGYELNKFAELIVKECVIAIKDSDEFSDDAVDFIDQEIKQHFGVEV